ncbi:MAG: hypothetical protein KKH12_16005 [Gammaproteobacteria bacterium]|nr:hypothetical protein [Gammaproteobacteria bacterium]
MNDKFKGWRRLIFAGVVLTAATISLAMGYLDADAWKELMSWLSATYIGSDGVEKVASAWSSRGEGANLSALIAELSDKKND